MRTYNPRKQNKQVYVKKNSNLSEQNKQVYVKKNSNQNNHVYVNFNVGRKANDITKDSAYAKEPGWIRIHEPRVEPALMVVPENTHYVAFGDGSNKRQSGISSYSTTVYRIEESKTIPMCDISGTGVYSIAEAEACAILAAIQACRQKIEVVSDCQVAIRRIFFSNEGGVYKEIRNHLIRNPGRIKISFMYRNSCEQMLRAHNNCNVFRKDMEERMSIYGTRINTFFRRIDYITLDATRGYRPFVYHSMPLEPIKPIELNYWANH